MIFMPFIIGDERSIRMCIQRYERDGGDVLLLKSKAVRKGTF